MTLREDLKKAIKTELDLAECAFASPSQSVVIERILDEIFAVMKSYAVLAKVAQNATPSGGFISADPSGAERQARTLP